MWVPGRFSCNQLPIYRSHLEMEPVITNRDAQTFMSEILFLGISITDEQIYWE